jgi:hypothetical protein
MPVQEDQCARAGDASLYVFGELVGRRQDSFERHMRHCEECSDEVSLLRQMAAAEPLLGTAHLPPEEEDDPGRRGPTPTLTVAAANARAARLAAEKAAAEAEANGDTPPPPRQPARPALRTIPGGAGAPPRSKGGLMGGRRLLKTPVPRSVMVSFLALGVLAVATIALSSRAASLRYFRIQAGWPHGGAAVKLIGNQLEMLVEDMPKPPAGFGYQVWVAESATKKLTPTTAWLHLNSLRQAGANVPGNYHEWDAIAIYAEPLTGKDTAGRAAVAVGDLRSLR